MMNVVIYARFSSHSQTEQSIEGQLKVCYEFAKRNDYNVIGEYIDRAISGEDAEKRPDFQRMIADSAKRQFNAILVYRLDRFSRNRYDSVIYKEKLRKYGVCVLSAKENISDDASGVLMESVLEGMAEYYSVELAQKIRRGMQINAEKCLAVGGMKILGYKIQEKSMPSTKMRLQLLRKFSKCTQNALKWQRSYATLIITASKLHWATILTKVLFAEF